MRSKRRSVSWLVLAVATFGVAGAAGAKTKDKLVYVDGRVEEVDGIVEASVSKVRVRGGGVVDPRQLLAIEHGDAPAAFAAGEAALRAGLFHTALERFEAAMGGGGPEWVGAWARVRSGEALARAALAGDQSAASRAVSTLEGFLSAHPDHFLEPRALRALGMAQRVAGDLNSARASFERLADRKYGEYWELWGRVGLAEVLLDQQQYTDALTEVEKVIQTAASREGFGEILAAANAVKGRTFMAKGDFDEAIRFYEELARAGKGTSAQSAADSFVNLGKAYEQRARGDDKRRALMEYRRVAMYYPGAPGAYAEALYRAAKLLEEFGEKDKAQAFFRELKARCPESPQAKKVN